MSYIDGYVVPVPSNKKGAYRESAEKMGEIFIKEYGATRMVECWGTDVPDGKVTDFKRSVNAEASESIVFSWIEWPSKEVRDQANEKMRNDARFASMEMPFDGKRMILGGFEVLVETKR